ncbi:MAG: DUF2293 domain-containing protein [Planctomycetaceae bacterium]
MPLENRIVSPTATDRVVKTADGKLLTVPADWILLPPGDAGLTRRVKAEGPTWGMQEKRGRKIFSRGIWAPAERIQRHQAALEAERSTEAYAKKQQGALVRREKKQTAYVEDFRGAVLTFLRFDVSHQTIAEKLADAVTTHATPVGSGTVARTERIPIEKRAEAAVIAWMRHQTTAYDHMKIARIKGERREVRRELAEISRSLLEKYRQGKPRAASCPLLKALDSSSVSS